MDTQKRNILIFCSNPVNGGTVRMFYECVTGLRKELDSNYSIYSCTNMDNPVELYKKMDKIIYLPITSEEQICKTRGLYGGSVLERFMKRIYRGKIYGPIKKNNIKEIKKYLLENKIDTVIVHNGGYVGDDLCNQVLKAAYLCRNTVKKRICVFHNDFEKNLFYKIRLWKYDKTISKETTEIVTVSQYTKNRLQASTYITRNIRVIYNGIKVENSRGKNKVIDIDDSKRNILMIGNFMKNKGQREFIEVAYYLYSNNPSYRFTIIGNIYEQEYYEECVKLIKKNNLQDVFKIYHNINNASDYIDMFDVMVVPSLYDESFGLISVEAMAKGCPVVAYACGGIPEVVIDGRNGYIVPIGAKKEMAARVRELVDNEDLRKKMRIQCIKDYEERFSVDAMTEKYVELL